MTAHLASNFRRVDEGLGCGEGMALGLAPTHTVDVGARRVWTEVLCCLAWQRWSRSP